MAPKKNKIPFPGAKKDPYTGFMKKQKWMSALKQSNLDLSGRNIQKEGARIVANVLNKNQFVTNLTLTQNHLGDAGITEFAQMLRVNTVIRMINVSINDLTDVGGMMLASAFRDNTTLTNIIASGNSFGDDTAVAFAHILKSNREIKNLDLSWNAIGSKGAEALGAVQHDNRDFTLHIYQNRIGDDGAVALATAHKEKARPELHANINWWQNDIGKKGSLGIAHMVEKNVNLNSLNLSWNSVGTEGAKAIAIAMAVNVGTVGFCKMTSLHLGNCVIDDPAGEEFGKLLARNPPLTSLALPHNRICSEGAMQITEGMKSNTTLTSLNLAHNKIGDSAAPGFAGLLGTTSSLQALWLQRNEMKEEGKTLISNAIPKNTKMRVNYGAMDDLTPFTNYQSYGGKDPAEGMNRRQSRKFSSTSAMSSVTDNSSKRGGRSASRSKSISRGSVHSDGTG